MEAFCVRKGVHWIRIPQGRVLVVGCCEGGNEHGFRKKYEMAWRAELLLVSGGKSEVERYW